MTASTFPVRPTVEATTSASTAFAWAYRGDPDQSLACLEQMDPVALHGIRFAGALLARQVDQILGGGA